MKSIADAATGAAAAGGYPELSAEYILKANPDYILLADTGSANGGQDAATVGPRPGWSVLTAVKESTSSCSTPTSRPAGGRGSSTCCRRWRPTSPRGPGRPKPRRDRTRPGRQPRSGRDPLRRARAAGPRGARPGPDRRARPVLDRRARPARAAAPGRPDRRARAAPRASPRAGPAGTPAGHRAGGAARRAGGRGVGRAGRTCPLTTVAEALLVTAAVAPGPVGAPDRRRDRLADPAAAGDARRAGRRDARRRRGCLPGRLPQSAGRPVPARGRGRRRPRRDHRDRRRRRAAPACRRPPRSPGRSARSRSRTCSAPARAAAASRAADRRRRDLDRAGRRRGRRAAHRRPGVSAAAAHPGTAAGLHVDPGQPVAGVLVGHRADPAVRGQSPPSCCSPTGGCSTCSGSARTRRTASA